MASIVSLFVVSLVASQSQQTVTDGRVLLDVPSVNSASIVSLNGPWRFHAGDDLRWADPRFDDSEWSMLDPALPDGPPPNWQGRGWFRLRLALSDELINVPMALWFQRMGPMEVFVDGEKVAKFGDPTASMEDPSIRVSFTKSPVPITFSRAEVLVAIRYAMPTAITSEIEKGVAAEHCAVGVSRAETIRTEEAHELWTI
ncbi:MAG: hypothetical protein AAFN74_22510, partial [Myxococcota bacterium]